MHGRRPGAARAAPAGVRDWGDGVEHRVTDDDKREVLVTATSGALFAQLALHETHHRAQALNMLKHLGVTFGDLDFNALMMGRREV